MEIKCTVILFLITYKIDRERWLNERVKKEKSKPRSSQGLMPIQEMQ
jgi:hypothetical protein